MTSYLDILQADHSEARIVAAPSEAGSRTVAVVYAADPPRARLTAAGKKRSTEAREDKMAKGKGKKKKAGKHGKKLTKAERRAINLRNLKKARAARKAMAKGKGPKKKAGAKKAGKRSTKLTKSERAAISRKNLKKARAALAKTRGKAVRAPKMPKKAPVRTAARRPKGRKLTKAERRAINLKNLRKAQAARRRNKKSGKKHKVGAYSYPVKSKTVHVPAHKSWEAKHKGRTRAQRAASMKNIKKAQAAARRKGRKGSTKAREAGKGKRRQTSAQRAASLANLKLARKARAEATQRHDVGSYSYHRQGGTRHVPSHLSYEYAMANPFSAKELGWGVGTGLVYFLLTDTQDRFWATHALTAKGTSDASGHALYSDVPVTTATFWTGYANAYNPTAICAPMNVVRWISGAAFIAAPLVGARFVDNPFWRSQLQVAGYAAILRIGGKAAIDLFAKLLMWTKTGQRLYDGEMRAAVLTSADQSPLASLPGAGVGGVPAGCGSCMACALGVGSCSAPGVGYPSMPRETATPTTATSTTTTSTSTPAVPAPPLPTTSTTTTTTTTESTTSNLAGVSGLLPPKSRSLYDWGHKEVDAEEAA